MAGNNGSSLRMIPLKDIQENPVALRAVKRKSEKYVELVDSIRKVGILNPISVREVKHPETNQMFYAVLDGLHRFTAAGDAGMTEIPCHVIPLKNAQVLEAQIIANVHKVETSPKEYADQLERILIQNPLMTASELADKLGKSPTWLSKMLSLAKVKNPNIIGLINEGKIKLSNATALAKLPDDEQENFADRAMTQSPEEFVPLVTGRVKEIKDAKRQGKDVKPEGFVAVPRLKKLLELKAEVDNLHTGKDYIATMGISNPLEAWKLAINWAMSMDPKSVEVRKQKDKEYRDKKQKEKVQKAEERARKRAEEAAQRVAAFSE